MDISRGQWGLAMLAAASVHLLLAALLWWGKPTPEAPTATPRGVMVSLDRFDAAPPPKASTASAPIESATPEAPIPSAPTPATAAAPEQGNAVSAATPEAASDIGPQPAPANTTAGGTPAAGEKAAGSGEATTTSPAASQADAVTIRPEDTPEAIAPQEQVVARNANLTEATTDVDQPSGNGAYGRSHETTDDYIVRLRAWLSRHKQYPQDARRNKVEGTVRLYLIIDQNGRVLESRIQQSSGSESLDHAAQQMVERAEPLPNMAASMQRNRLELIVPVVFSLH